MMKKEEFLSLKRDEMFATLRQDFPALAVGKSRAKKDELVDLYRQGLQATMDGMFAPDPEVEERKPETQQVEAAPVEEPVKESAPAKEPDTRTVPIREFEGLRFVVYEGDPMRALTHREEHLLRVLCRNIPKLGPKQQTADKGNPRRRVYDPFKTERRAVKDALHRLRWTRVHVLAPEEKGEREARHVPILQENM